MKPLLVISIIGLGCVAFRGFAATLYVDINSTNPTAPYVDWSSAATNIQDAIEASNDGDLVLVTNGIYSTGGKIAGGDLLNRVAITKAITVKSVNGALGTFIEGRWSPTVPNGLSAVRCAWLTNGAILDGFTIRGGATRVVAASANEQMNGGGVWGASTNAFVVNCIIATNLASRQGGGAYKVTLKNCMLLGNRAVGSGQPNTGFSNAGAGGGAAECFLENCILDGNFADQGDGGGTLNCRVKNSGLTKNTSFKSGAAASGGTLVNSTITGNVSAGSLGYGGAVYGAALTNCIVWNNMVRSSYPYTNYASCTLRFSCATPLASGDGNIEADPGLLGDQLHLSETSPCIGAGTNIAVSGTDIDGQAWNPIPSMGCDEWHAAALIAKQPDFKISPSSRTLRFSTVVAGQSPLSSFWYKDGLLVQDGVDYRFSNTPNLVINGLGPEHAGLYQFVASNVVNNTTSQVARLVIHCVDAATTNPVSPFLSWNAAAATIQDAIDVAEAGCIVLVTNGIYSSGGKAMTGTLTNRVALDKPVTVMSMNGFKETVIQGARDPIATNGPLAVRCAWLTNGALLSGFTLRDGATQELATGNTNLHRGGGGWGTSSNAMFYNCLFTNNNAGRSGGGVAYASVNNSILVGNKADEGGGAYAATLTHCTVLYNSGSSGAGVYAGAVRNSIVWGNPDTIFPRNYASSLSSFSYSCTSPLPPGTGNLTATPRFIDAAYRLPLDSPCRAAGHQSFSSGEDFDGDSWIDLPSIGCDEVIPTNLIGPLSIAIQASQTNVLVNRPVELLALVAGRVSRIDWSLGNGLVITNTDYVQWRSWSSPGTNEISLTAYNNDYPEGVMTTLPIVVSPIVRPSIGSASLLSNVFEVTFTAQSGVHYAFEYATNLSEPIFWRSLKLLPSATEGLTTMTDPGWTNDSPRFYRLKAY